MKKVFFVELSFFWLGISLVYNLVLISYILYSDIIELTKIRYPTFIINESLFEKFLRISGFLTIMFYK